MKKMKTIAKFAAVTLAVGLAAGCATVSDLENVRAIAEEAKAAAAKANAAAAEAQTTANAASTKANKAMNAAEDANNCCIETNEKIDRMFKETMRK